MLNYPTVPLGVGRRSREIALRPCRFLFKGRGREIDAAIIHDCEWEPRSAKCLSSGLVWLAEQGMCRQSNSPLSTRNGCRHTTHLVRLCVLTPVAPNAERRRCFGSDCVYSFEAGICTVDTAPCRARA